MAKKTEFEALRALTRFYGSYAGTNLQTRTEVNREMEKRYPNWERDPAQKEAIRRVVLGRLPIDAFDDEQQRTFEDVFRGWTIAQMKDFISKHEQELKDMYKQVRWDGRDADLPLKYYVHRKHEEKMRAASERLKSTIGDSLGFTGFDKTVKVYGGKEIRYSELQAQWAAEQQKYGKR